MSGTFLEPFLESIQTLPCNLKRNLTLLRDLDTNAFDLAKSADELSDEFINEVNNLSPSEKYARYNKILSLYDKALYYSEEKKQLAHQTYNMVDKQIQQLDNELAKFDAELEEKNETPIATPIKIKKKSSKLNKDKSAIKASAKSVEQGKNGRQNQKINDAKSQILENTKNILITKPELCLNMEVDPNEPLYCLCHQVSFGEMVGCDEADCPYEWFHFSCVGLKVKPKGKWYCPDCTRKKKSKQAQ